MFLSSLLFFLTVVSCSGLALVALTRDVRSLAHWVFAAGMAALALETLLSGLSLRAESYVDVVAWQHGRMLAASVTPGLWLLFSVIFARRNSREGVTTWRWPIVAAFVLPVGIATYWRDTLFFAVAGRDTAARWELGLAWAGYLHQFAVLLIAVFIVMNLERILRASTGSIRWQIKLLVLGLGGFFAVRVYTASQALLFSSVTSTLEFIDRSTLLVATGLLWWSFRRTSSFKTSLYLSGTALYHSLSIVIIGVYLLFVGILAKAVHYVGGEQTLPFQAFVLFLTLLALAGFLLSDEWRVRSKRFLNLHFHRPQYDYRREWAKFTQETASLLDKREICETVVKLVSRVFGVACASIWLFDETDERLVYGGSTVFSEDEARELDIAGAGGMALLRLARGNPWPIDFATAQEGWASEFSKTYDSLLRSARARYCVSLVAGQSCLGVLTLDARLTRESLSVEDYELLKLIADQTASSLLNIRLSQQLVKAKEAEALQSLSTFFVHDLKNLASTLSLTVQNLPVHFDNPEFRQDALRVISNSVNKMNAMCSRLSSVTKQLELQKAPTDLNGLIATTLAELNGSMSVVVGQRLSTLPAIFADAEQVQKVLLNLLLNAQEATGPQGEVTVRTEQHDGWATLAVTDNGPGMSRKFIEHSLFRPFQTTKSKGLGIGLFHSKKIIEAHHGRIEVESEEGKGSTFRVWLPVRGER